MSELNIDADYATQQAVECERQGHLRAAQGYRNMRWASVDREQQGKASCLNIEAGTVIHEIHGDILTTQAAALVNPVNTMGICGAGLAAQLKQRYPGMFAIYRDACSTGMFRTGSVLPVHIGPHAPQHVICVPTKREWWLPSRIGYIESGLSALLHELIALDIPSVAVPALGCGLGGLEWVIVRELIIDRLGDVNGLTVELYVPRPRSPVRLNTY